MPLSTRLINLRIHRHLDKTPYLQILLFRSSSVHQPNVFTNELQGDSRQTIIAVSRFMQRTLLVVLIMEPFWDVEARCFCTCSIQTSVYEVE